MADANNAYAFATASWLAVQALPLLLTPGLVISGLSFETRPATDVELYLARCVALALLTIATFTLLAIILIPADGTSAEIAPDISSSSAPPPRYQAESASEDETAPATTTSTSTSTSTSASPAITTTTNLSRPAALLLTTALHTADGTLAWVFYTRSGRGHQTGFALGALGSGALALMGAWCVLFGGGAARISRRTGRDKHVSGWPFGERRGVRQRVRDTGPRTRRKGDVDRRVE